LNCREIPSPSLPSARELHREDREQRNGSTTQFNVAKPRCQTLVLEVYLVRYNYVSPHNSVSNIHHNLTRTGTKQQLFAEAHTNLAAQYLRLGKFDMAREQAKLAMEISGPNTKDLTNLAAASWAVGQAVDALKFARAAVRLDQRALGAQYIMGSILVLSPKTLREGMRHLELAAEKFPSAAQKLATYRQTVAAMQ
jgi:tetratricopeptide (TPR) repeat protein